MKNKFTLSAFLILLAVVGVVLAVGQVNLDSVSSPSANPGATANVDIVVSNAGAGTIPTVTLSSTVLSGPGGTITVPSITSITNLNNVTSQQRTVSVSVPFIAAGAYNAQITAEEAGSAGANQHILPYVLTVNTVNDVDVLTFSTSSPLTIRGEEGNKFTQNINVKNIGSTTLDLSGTEFTYLQTDFQDNDDDLIIFTFTDIGSLTPGQTGTTTMTADVQKKVDLDSYRGTITLLDGTGATDNFDVDLIVQPEVCKDGVRSDGKASDSSSALLQIDVQDPDNNDEFAPGDVIDIDVDVENNDDNDMDVVVEAFLYNLNEDDEIERVESKRININDDDEENFNLELKIPLTDLDDGDSYVLYIKAYEDGNEDDNCNEESIDIDIEREDHQTVVEDFSILPSLVSCNDIVSFSVDVINIGTKNEDNIYIEVKNSELGLNLRSDEFDLNDGDDATRRFTFTVPDNARQGEYSIEAVVTYDDGDEKHSEFSTLRVDSCGVQAESFLRGTISLEEVSFENSEVRIPVTVTNKDVQSGSFEVRVTGISNWAEPVSSETVALDAGQTKTLVFVTSLKNNLPETLRITASLLSNGNVVDSVSKDISSTDLPQITGGFLGVSDNLGNVFWIVANVVLIVLAVWLIKALFVRKK